ncbi:MAG: hypothetical protein JJU33_03595 [Phycisphaerales bacterium]|nr:hypothetical protein [Phycisphaerales bacterium]
MTGTLKASGHGGGFRIEGRGVTISVYPDSRASIREFAKFLRTGAPARRMVDRLLSAGGLTLLARGPLGTRIWYRPDHAGGTLARAAARLTGMPVSGFGNPPATLTH